MEMSALKFSSDSTNLTRERSFPTGIQRKLGRVQRTAPRDEKRVRGIQSFRFNKISQFFLSKRKLLSFKISSNQSFNLTFKRSVVVCLCWNFLTVIICCNGISISSQNIHNQNKRTVINIYYQLRYCLGVCMVIHGDSQVL